MRYTSRIKLRGSVRAAWILHRDEEVLVVRRERDTGWLTTRRSRREELDLWVSCSVARTNDPDMVKSTVLQHPEITFAIECEVVIASEVRLGNEPLVRHDLEVRWRN